MKKRRIEPQVSVEGILKLWGSSYSTALYKIDLFIFNVHVGPACFNHFILHNSFLLSLNHILFRAIATNIVSSFIVYFTKLQTKNWIYWIFFLLYHLLCMAFLFPKPSSYYLLILICNFDTQKLKFQCSFSNTTL